MDKKREERSRVIYNRKEEYPLVFKEDLKEVFNYLLSEVIDPYSDFQTKKENCISLLQFFYEVCQSCGEAGQQSRLSRTIKYCNTIRDEVKFEEFYYNLVLSFEGKSLLNNFGFSNRFGDRIKGNPEKQSILTGGRLGF